MKNIEKLARFIGSLKHPDVLTRAAITVAEMGVENRQDTLDQCEVTVGDVPSLLHKSAFDKRSS